MFVKAVKVQSIMSFPFFGVLWCHIGTVPKRCTMPRPEEFLRLMRLLREEEFKRVTSVRHSC